MIRLDRSWWCLLAALLGLGLLYGVLCRPHIAGIYYDDGIYLQGARELALGHGYRLASDWSSPAIVKYPPFFSFVLSLIWRCFSEFPQNLPLLKGFNILLSLSGLALLYAYCRTTARNELPMWAMLAFVLYWGLNPGWIYPAIDILSEPLYFFLSLGALWVAARLVQSEKPLSFSALAPLVLLSVLACYTRSIGLSLVLGLSVWLWRQYGAGWMLRYALSCLALIAPWFFWCKAQPSMIQKIGAFYSVSFNQTYWTEMMTMLLQGNGIVNLLLTALFELPKDLTATLFPFLTLLRLPPMLLFLFGCILLIAAAAVMWRCVRQGKLSPVSLYLLFYVLCCVAWPFPEQYPRFLIVMLPLLAWQGLCRFSGRLQQSAYVVMPLVLLAAFFNLNSSFGHYPIPIGDRLVTNSDEVTWSEYVSFFQDLQYRLKPSDVVWGPYSAMYPLYVLNSRVIARNVINSPSLFYGRPIEESQALIFAAVLETFRKNHVTHVLLEPKFGLNTLHELQEGRVKVLIDRFPQSFSLEAQSDNGLIKLYRFKG